MALPWKLHSKELEVSHADQHQLESNMQMTEQEQKQREKIR